MNPISLLRPVALIEAISYLILLGVAMPLKYLWGMPHAVSVVGLVHGLLFVVFVVALLRTWLDCRWSLARVSLIFGASFLPFVPFFLDRKIRGWSEECKAPQSN